MNMTMNIVNQYQKDVLDVLGIIYGRYLRQKTNVFEIMAIDLKTSKMLAPNFFETVRTLEKDGFKLVEVSEDEFRSKWREWGDRDTALCEITVPKDFEAYYQAKIKTAGMSDTKHLIEKDTNGDFLYNGKFLKLSKDTLGYKILDALYTNSDQEGYLSYEAIEKYLVDKKEAPIEDSEKRDKRILNAISEGQGLFRRATINGALLKNETPSGAPLIDIRRGKGLVLSNPAI